MSTSCGLYILTKVALKSNEKEGFDKIRL